MKFDNAYRKEINDCQPYIAGEAEDTVRRRYHLERVIKLGSNENPYGPFKHAQQAMIRSISSLNRYPEDDFLNMKLLIANEFNLKPDNVAIGSGAGNILETLAKEFLNTGDEVLIAQQSYRLYREISKMMGAKVIGIPLTTDYQFNLAKFQKNITPKTKIIWICNPNNPTSTVTNPDELERFIAGLPKNIWIVIDEAYANFSDRDHLPNLLKFIEKKRVIIVRTFSKYYGLAGARLGYALADAKTIQGYDTVTEPFSCNRAVLAGAIASLKFDRDQTKSVLNKIKDDRTWLSEQLRQLDFKVANSQSNFIFAELPSDIENATAFCQSLMQHGVIIRDCTPWGYPRHIRVTIGTHEELELFLEQVKLLLKVKEM